MPNWKKSLRNYRSKYGFYFWKFVGNIGKRNPFSYIYDMRIIVCLILLLTSTAGFSQSPALARNYFKQGEFDKSLHLYEQLYKSQPMRVDYLKGLIENLQELDRFGDAEEYLLKHLSNSQNQPQLYVDLGYNYTRQNEPEKAQEFYTKAMDAIRVNTNAAFQVGKAFRDYNLLENAAEVYEFAMKESNNLDFNGQLAQIYGEQGDLKKMFDIYLDVIEKNPAYKATAQRIFSRYISEDPGHEANEILRRSILKRSQENPDVVYNELLSWFFIQQHEFGKAFTQEKAIFRRSENKNLNGMVNLANIAMSGEAYDSAQEIIEFVIENSLTADVQLNAYQVLMNIQVISAKPKEFPAIEKKFESLFQEFGTGRETYGLQLDYNHFLAFKTNKKEIAIEHLRDLLKQRLSAFEEARVKMELADILVSDEKFNQALIFYSQIQSKVQNDVLAQEARFKVARTSYFKGDFEWAQTQLDVLKKSTSQLIANDAMKLALLIKDNNSEDSVQTGLKKYARADLLDLQEKYDDAIAILNEVLRDFEGSDIEDEALLKQGVIFEKTENFKGAENNYLKIIENFSEDILADEALFRVARLYETKFDLPDEAKKYYERILFEHEDSIYFVEARRKYRMLRGDAIN